MSNKKAFFIVFINVFLIVKSTLLYYDSQKGAFMKKKIIILFLLIITIIVAYLYSPPTSLSSTTATIHFIDTGQSDCILIEATDHVILIDAGDNNDEQMIVEYLNKLNIHTIDYLINTHPDADHAGGLDAVVENFDIITTYVSNGSANTKTYQDFILSLSNKSLTPSVPLEDIKIELNDNQYLKFYNTKNTSSDANTLSLLTLFVDHENTFLFTGDAPKMIEEKYMHVLPTIDVLKVSHHGSKSSSSEAFLKNIDPLLAIIECGRDNKYGHPHKEVINRFEKLNIDVLRTDLEGTIIIESDGKRVITK